MSEEDMMAEFGFSTLEDVVSYARDHDWRVFFIGERSKNQTVYHFITPQGNKVVCVVHSGGSISFG